MKLFNFNLILKKQIRFKKILTRNFSNQKHILSSQSGMAMMMAIGTMLVLSLLAAELVYQSSVYNGVIFRVRDQLRAKMLARTGLRIGLLQLVATQKAREKAKSLGVDAALADKIWQTPMILPPPSPGGLSKMESDSLSAFNKSLGLEGVVSISISGENDRLNLNNLIWLTKEQETKASTDGSINGGQQVGGNSNITPEQKKKALEDIRKSYVEIIDKVFENKRQDDEDFRNKYSNISAETLFGNLVAWMDPNTPTDGDNRAKNEYYNLYEPTPYSIKNAPLYSESELFMVKGFDETIARLFMDHFTVQSASGLDVNKASESLLHALIPEIGTEDLKKVIARRTDETLGGAYKSEEDFWKFVEPFLGNNAEAAKKRFTDKGIKILADNTSYRVIISSESGSAKKVWVAYVGEAPPEIAQANAPGQTSQQPQFVPDISKSAEENEAAKAAFDEKNKGKKSDSKSLNILYLKAD